MHNPSFPDEDSSTAWDRESIRRLLSAAFDDTELTTFCFERFDPVYRKFSSGLDKEKKIQLLLDYAVRRRQLTTLPGLVRKYNPDQYAHYERLVRLYERVQLASREQRWEQVKQLCTQVQSLERGYRDVADLLEKAEAKLKRRDQLYQQAQEAQQEQRWNKVLQLCQQIEILDPAYQKVQRLRDIAEAALRKSAAQPAPPAPQKRRGTARWVGALALLALIVGGTLFIVFHQPAPPELTIESHRDGDLVDRAQEITGTYRNLGAGWQLWSLVQSESEDYWINDHISLDQREGEWQLTSRFGYVGTRSIGEQFKLLVLAVKEHSDAERYLLNARGGPITELPEQVPECIPTVTLVRSSPTDRWLADFWDNEHWEGEPVATQEISATYLFHEWWEPPFDGMPETSWTARFVRRVHFSEDGEYCFYRVRDDEVHVFIDEKQLDIPQDRQDWMYAESACRELTAGDHDISVDFANLTGDKGVIEFWYDSPSPPVGTLSETWQATFFPTAYLGGKPVWITTLPGPFLDFQSTVTDEIPAVSFGAIFSRTFSVTEDGFYRFELSLDDGARFYIDDVKVLDEWHSGPANYAVEKPLDASEHTLRLEYYEYQGDQYAKLVWEKILAPVPPVQHILFASDRDGNYEVYVMDANGANPMKLTDNTHPDRDPSWSPDGRRIIFASDPEGDGTLVLYVMNADGNNVTSLGVAGYQPRWSPDGSRIAFVAEGGGGPEIYVMDADDINTIQLTNNDALEYTPDWSPDGSRIVFETGRDGNDNQEIYVMNADGSNPVNLSQNPAWDGCPVWSPDGRLIAFFSNRDGNDEIYVMDSDGSNQRRLTYNEINDQFPTWSPDGRFLIFEGHDPESKVVQLYLIDVQGAEPPVRLTKDQANHEHPQWSPPGYGYTFENLTNGNAVKQGAITVAGDYVWTGGSGGLVRWRRDDPAQNETFTSESGLAENNVKAILATSETTLWFGTGEWPYGGSGLSRYEFGAEREHWRTYTAGDGLGSNTILALYQDSQGRIWAGTWGAGPRIFDGGRWQGFAGAGGASVYSILEATDGIFWFSALDVGVMRYDPSTSGAAAWQRFNLMELLGSDGEGYNYPTAIVEGAPGELWIATNAGVVRYDGQTWQAAGGALDNVWTSSAVRDVDGALWFATNDGLVRLDADGQRTYTTADGLTGIIHALYLDDQRVLWAAGNGLNRYDRESERWRGYRVSTDQTYNEVSAIWQDDEEALWFGHSYSWPGGVSRYAPGSDDEWQTLSTLDGLSAGAVHAIIQDRDGTMWFGFDQAGGGVCSYDLEQDERPHCFQPAPKGLASAQVDAILQTHDPDGTLWFGTSGGGLSRFDRERWETFTQSNSDLLSDQVHCLAEDGDKALWITTDQGINHFSYEKGTWVSFTADNSKLIADEVLALALDGDDGVWFGTTQGLSHYDTATRRWRTFEGEGIPKLPDRVDNCTQALHVDRHGTLWVGTDEGLYRYTPGGGWLRLTTTNGLASNHVLAIFEAADHTLWIGTPAGVSQLRVEE